MNNAYQYEKIFRALGDQHRIRILGELNEREMNAGEILEIVDVVQSTLSHHMRTLCESGLVNARKQGKWTCYTINRETVQAARAYLGIYLEESAPEEAPHSVIEEMPITEPEVREETGTDRKKIREKGKEREKGKDQKEREKVKGREKTKEKGKAKSGKSKKK